MSTRSVVLTAVVAACVSSLVTLAVALLVLPPLIRTVPDPQAVQASVRTRELLLVDEQGTRRGAWSADTYGSTLALADGNGRERVRFDASGIGDAAKVADVAEVLTFDGVGVARTSLGQIASNLHTPPHPAGYGIEVNDPSGRSVWRAP